MIKSICLGRLKQKKIGAELQEKVTHLPCRSNASMAEIELCCLPYLKQEKKYGSGLETTCYDMKWFLLLDVNNTKYKSLKQEKILRPRKPLVFNTCNCVLWTPTACKPTHTKQRSISSHLARTSLITSSCLLAELA